MKLPEISDMGANIFRIVIDQHTPDSGEFKGKLLDDVTGQAIEFSSMSRLLILIDSMLDMGVSSPFGLGKMPTQCADVEIEVLFRQNYTWQGKLRFPKLRKEAIFRSALELIMVMETALGS